MTGKSLSSILVVADLRSRSDSRWQPKNKHRSMAGREGEHRREKSKSPDAWVGRGLTRRARATVGGPRSSPHVAR